MSALSSALASLIHAPFAAAIGWALLHSLWQGAVLAGAFAALLLVVRGPRVRYVAACAALLLMLAGFCVTLFLMLPKGLGSVRAFNSVSPAAFAWPVQPAGDPADSFAAGLAAVVPWLSLFWVAGVCVVYALRFAGGVSLGRLRRRGVCSAPERWQQQLARLRTRLRVSRPVVLLESCLADTPMVLGHFRPLILMPVGVLAGLSPAQVEAILLHELAHVRRCDYLVNLLQRLVEGLFFYHPAIWWISHRARDERENCCDDAVVAISRNSQDYAAALAALEENRMLAGGAAVAATGGTLVKRIRRLLYPQAPGNPWAPFFAAVLFLATATVAVAALWQAAPSQHASATTQTQAQATASAIADLQKQSIATEQLLSAAEAELKPLQSQVNQLQVLQETLSAQAAPSQDSTVTTETQTRATVSMIATLQEQLIAADQELEQLRSQANQLQKLEDTPAAQTAPSQQTSAHPAADWTLYDPVGAQARAEAALSPQYRDWLQKQVVYIITPAERAAFVRLKTDSDRDTFITNFWAKRNPTPGTADNAFKEEYYRRIAYANEHYGGPADAPGWRTDRGRIYIVYGPPDEVDPRLKSNPPTETWRYLHVQGQGDNGTMTVTFADRSGNGDYRISDDYRLLQPASKLVPKPAAVVSPTPHAQLSRPPQSRVVAPSSSPFISAPKVVPTLQVLPSPEPRLIAPLSSPDLVAPKVVPTLEGLSPADPRVTAPPSSPAIIAPKVLPTISAPKAMPAAPSSVPQQAPVHDAQSARNEPIIVGSDPLVPLVITGPYFPAGAQLRK